MYDENSAVYLSQVIEEYKGNPFIEALPPIMSAAQAVDALTVEPGYHESERELDAFYRFHCIQRLLRSVPPPCCCAPLTRPARFVSAPNPPRFRRCTPAR